MIAVGFFFIRKKKFANPIIIENLTVKIELIKGPEV